MTMMRMFIPESLRFAMTVKTMIAMEMPIAKILTVLTALMMLYLAQIQFMISFGHHVGKRRLHLTYMKFANLNTPR